MHVLGKAGLVSAGTLAAMLAGIAQAQVLGAPMELDNVRQQLDEEVNRLNALQRSLDEHENKLNEERAQLREQRQRIDALYNRLRARGLAPSTGISSGNGPQGGDTRSSDQPERTQSAQANTPVQQPVGEAPSADKPPEVAPIFRDQGAGVLTPEGKLVLEPSLSYVHSTNDRVALVGFTIIPAITIGLIDIRRVSRDAFSAALTARYGLTNRLEIEGKVPYVYSTSTTITRPLATASVTDSAFDSDGKGIGDLEFAARYQINDGGIDKPFYVGSLRVRAPTGTSPYDVAIDPTTGLATELATGTGHVGIQPGVTVLFPSDPVVFFGGTSYLYNVPKDVGNGYGRVSPGNVIDFNFGMGLALNEKASFSFGYQQSMVSKPTQEGATTVILAPTSTLVLGTMRFGFSYKLNDKQNVNLTLGAGVTREAPDLELTLRVPTSF